MYGTASITDLLSETSQNVVQFGETRIWDAFQASLQAHNAIVTENMMEFVERTTDLLRGTGGYDRMVMEDIDEYGDPGAQKVAAGGNLGFPLRMVGVGLQWTYRYLQNATVAAVATKFRAAQEADVRRVLRDLRRALYSPVNYNFKDRFDPASPTLAVKALANADSFFIPVGPNGEAFDASTHTHYLANSGLTTASLDALIDTVREHFDSGEVRLVINAAQESAVRGLSGFDRYLDARVQPAFTTQSALGGLDIANTQNRAIGIYNGAEVWVKPWAIPSYILCYRRQGGEFGRKVLAYRHSVHNDGNLMILSQKRDYPLEAEQMGREFGIGVQDRIGAAVLFTASGTYAAPTLS